MDRNSHDGVRARGAIRSGARRFMQGEASGGILLLLSAVFALIVANSPWSDRYFAALHAHLGELSLLHWINDGLMALFFLLIGLEVKRELVSGHLSSWSRRLLPGAAAVAGMTMPALVYVAFNWNNPADLRGWAIPAATDIAFALGILALLGSRVPVSLKILLTAIAVIDDLLAIVVIALFYTGEIALAPLGLAMAGLTILIGLNKAGVRALAPYLLIGIGIWYGVLLSGVHATLAGVAVALTIPLRARGGGRDPHPPLERLEHGIHPWITFLIVPIFGFANAGVAFGGMTAADVLSPLPIGIALGLFLGKQVGIFGTIFALVRLDVVDVPAHATWRQVYGMATLCGIGFTMSLFIGGLAFRDADHAVDAVKLGVFAGSVLAGVAGWILLYGAPSEGEVQTR
ncbi:MAG TPA: Na+/H+ antiporter NhaA [Sphingomonas sp.]|jgi:NhaA family Na+:H+ antiporter|uniref:Na+/H+ antiporter NhaA n=1 Tax=Sphingomonas sp. TaxID=28214 RepID=UPI002EDA30A6